jgi:hypothetical protein
VAKRSPVRVIVFSKHGRFSRMHVPALNEAQSGSLVHAMYCFKEQRPIRGVGSGQFGSPLAQHSSGLARPQIKSSPQAFGWSWVPVVELPARHASPGKQSALLKHGSLAVVVAESAVAVETARYRLFGRGSARAARAIAVRGTRVQIVRAPHAVGVRRTLRGRIGTDAGRDAGNAGAPNS